MWGSSPAPDWERKLWADPPVEGAVCPRVRHVFKEARQ